MAASVEVNEIVDTVTLNFELLFIFARVIVSTFRLGGFLLSGVILDSSFEVGDSTTRVRLLNIEEVFRDIGRIRLDSGL